MDDQDLASAISDGSLPSCLQDLEPEALGKLGEQLAALHNHGAIDVVQYFEALGFGDLTPQQRHRICDVLESFCGALRETPLRACSLFHNVHTRLSRSDAYQLEKGFEVWSSSNPEQLGEFAALLKSGAVDSPFLGYVLFAWRRQAPMDALESALEFSGDERPGMRRQAILFLGAVGDMPADEAAHVETRLADLLSSADPDVQRAAIAAIARRLDSQGAKSPRLIAALDTAADAPSQDVRHELIAGLVHHKKAYPAPLRAKVLELMRSVQTDCGGTLNLVDLALYDMDVDKDREIVFGILTALMTQETGAPDFKSLDSITHKLETADHKVLGWYAARWLLDGNMSICNQLNSLFPPLATAPYEFDLSAFALSDAEIFYLVRKINAYLLFSHGPAVSLLCACLMAMQPKGRSRLETDIASFWLRNFPGDLEIFDAVCEAFPRKGLNASIKRLRASVRAYEAPLRALPENPALQPSEMERRAQAELDHEQAKEISRRAEEGSLLLSLIGHRSTLLYGRSTVSYIYTSRSDEPIRQVIPMQSFQTSSPLPRMDRLYPTHLNYLLFRFRAERRPE